MRPKLSIIIPMLNEERMIVPLLHHLRTNCGDFGDIELLVVDGGSQDNSVEAAKNAGARVLISQKGRAKQMNIGAKQALGSLLYFLHADTLPPKYFDLYIKKAVAMGFRSGCFRMRFNTRNSFLRAFSFLTQFNILLCRGGDQSLFVAKTLFNQLGGFNESYIIYEDVEFISRLYKKSKFKVLPQEVITSVRRYLEMGWLRLQYHFGVIHLKHFMGQGPEALYDYYKKYVEG